VSNPCRMWVAGKKNGELLSLAEDQFDVLLTLDKNIPYQHDLKLGRIAILIVRAPSNRVQDLLPVIPDCLVALQSIEPGMSSASETLQLAKHRLYAPAVSEQREERMQTATQRVLRRAPVGNQPGWATPSTPLLTGVRR
jgi:hypothetical protein